MNIFIFLSLAFIATFVVGRFLEKIRVPWIFGALLFGSGLALYNPFAEITTSAEFVFLGSLGMYFLLFVVGFEIDLHKLRKLGSFIIKSTVITITLATLFGCLLVHFVFDYNWLISLIVSLSFATVGEAILIPILDEFKIVNTRLGQSIIGIGTLDDIVEIFSLILVAFFVGSNKMNYFNILIIVFSIIFLFLTTFIFSKFKKIGQKFSFLPIETLFLISLFILFLFIGIGEYGQAAAIGALLAGISLRTFLPSKRLLVIENEIRAMCYGFFAPIFFLWVGTSMDLNYLIKYPLLILLVAIVSGLAKLVGAYWMGHKKLGKKQSILLGLGISVRFSTSIIIIKILLDSKLIGVELYSIIIASSIIFNFVIPILFSKLLVKWNKFID